MYFVDLFCSLSDQYWRHQMIMQMITKWLHMGGQ